ncbi:MAG TPA: HEAT repeat domain-containing protein [Anaerolineales bacterium]|jgi:HEAT repeat protein|nr:HEAT repeat domain-containing protein [Anaerolineales bacterium]
MTTQNKLPFQKIIDELQDSGQELSRRSLQDFSDIDSASLRALLEAWPHIQPDRKRTLLEGLQSLADSDTLVSFDDFARAMLNDDDPQVRARAIRLLDECDDAKLVPTFIKILNEDADENARAEAAFALGKYVELGELEEVSEAIQRQAEDALLAKENSDDKLNVRRNALESLGYSSRPEVATLIESAFRRENPDWQASALLAMGFSADERWEEDVLARLDDNNPRVQLAAVQAAGQLGLASARLTLLKLLEDIQDDDVASAAIWSLSQIGGEDVRAYIENLLDQIEDDEQIEFLEEALDNLAFTEDLNRFDFMSIDTDELDTDSEE